MKDQRFVWSVVYGGFRLSYTELYLATLRCCFQQLIAQLASMLVDFAIDLETGLQEDIPINPWSLLLILPNINHL